MTPSIEDIYKEFLNCENSTQRLEYLFELAGYQENNSLCVLPKYKVQGCQSDVYLMPAEQDGLLYFHFDCNSRSVAGIIVILKAMYDGRQARLIVGTNINQFFEDIGLKTFISPMRSNGVNSIIKRIIEFATEKALKEQKPLDEPPEST